MAEKRDYYTVLGLSKNASETDVKAAYKKLAKQYHPDVSSESNAEEKFKEVQEAYSVLSNTQKKQAYDQFGFSGQQFSGGQGQGFGQGGFNFGGDFGFEDIFENLAGFGFGNMFGGRQRGPQRGNDLQTDLSITFEEAAFGTTKVLEIYRIEDCKSCKGTGSKKKERVTCETCKGSGTQTQVRRTPLGMFQTRSTCKPCKGAGKTVKDPCETCAGTGKIKAKKKLDVSIPEGIDAGMNLRLHHEGNAGDEGMSAGDLFVRIFIEPHEIFKRDNSDIFAEIPISFAEATLGADIDVPTLKGKANLSIPAGTDTSTIFKLKGQGIKHLQRSGKGDEFLKVIIQTPKKLSKKQKELFTQLAKEEGLAAKRKTFFDKLKDHFS